ncbi:putative HAM1-protein [Microstroma glucosiphilum]|uniref:Inosine triphosphate pyrophosphatase n=1 Tax=Pseudomicrostroma glucosiphilum TaxID=1684307 RepID=A0A316UFP4_9BASI|nr:putative HAM1-protein [Pseudomicrostroma glucosiphilum]PWN24076.1 putative HAM1-protein [Pseudomicrostroma glucosiphilum]
MAARKQLTFVTGNKNKLREVQQILEKTPSFPFEIVNRDLDVPEIQGTTQEVAIAKCRAAAKILNGPCLTEDTALSFHALSGLPGPYIKSFLSSLGHSGLNTLLDGFSDRSATAICTFAYCSSAEAEPILFEGRTEGKIVQPRGPSNFGWDPIIEIDGTGKTYAEMEAEEKNKLSHRYKALELLREYLTKQG